MLRPRSGILVLLNKILEAKAAMPFITKGETRKHYVDPTSMIGKLD